jgi:ABC-type sugar transport system substrate-binding protein
MFDTTTRGGREMLDRRRLLSLTGGAALGLAGANVAGGLMPTLAQDSTQVPITGKIGFGQPDRQADVYKPLIAGAKYEGERRGYEILESFAEGRADKQVAEINNWIGAGVDAVVILPLDENALQPLVEKAHEAGILFFAYASLIPNVDGFTIWENRRAADLLGEMIGNWVNEKLGGNAEIASLTAEFHETGRQRIHGAEAKILEIAPNAKIVNRTEAILAADAFKATQTILQANPNLNVVLCIADDGCIGAAQAFEATGRDPETIFIGGYDGSREVMSRILEGGPIRATMALPLFKIGRSVVYLPDNLLNGNEPTSMTHQYELVTQDTVELAQQLIADFGAE